MALFRCGAGDSFPDSTKFRGTATGLGYVVIPKSLVSHYNNMNIRSVANVTGLMYSVIDDTRMNSLNTYAAFTQLSYTNITVGADLDISAFNDNICIKVSASGTSNEGIYEITLS